MKHGSNRRLANVKTRSETGLDYVMSQINLNTPFGKDILKATKPYFPGEEEELRKELDKVENMIQFIRENRRSVDILSEAFMEVKDITYTIERSARNALSVVELYEIKTLLLMMRKISQILETTETEAVSYTHLRSPVRSVALQCVALYGKAQERSDWQAASRIMVLHNTKTFYAAAFKTEAAAYINKQSVCIIIIQKS